MVGKKTISFDVIPKSWTNQLKRVNMKLTNEEKQRMLEEVLLEDQTIRKVSDKYQVHYQHLFRLVQRAKHHGIESVLHKSQKRTYSVEFKLEVVKHVQNGNSRAKAALIYNIDQQLVRNWCLKYAEKGTKGLSNSRRRKMLREDRTEADSLYASAPPEKGEKISCPEALSPDIGQRLIDASGDLRQ